MNLTDHPFIAQKNFIWSLLAHLVAFPIFFLLLKCMLTEEDYHFISELFIITFSILNFTLFTVGFVLGCSTVEVIRFCRSPKETQALQVSSGMMSGYAQTQEHSRHGSPGFSPPLREF